MYLHVPYVQQRKKLMQQIECLTMILNRCVDKAIGVKAKQTFHINRVLAIHVESPFSVLYIKAEAMNV